MDDRPPLPLPDPVVTRPMVFDVIGKDGTVEVTEGTVLMSPEQFDAFAANVGELLRWVRDARQQLDYYRETNGQTDDERSAEN